MSMFIRFLFKISQDLTNLAFHSSAFLVSHASARFTLAAFLASSCLVASLATIIFSMIYGRLASFIALFSAMRLSLSACFFSFSAMRLSLATCSATWFASFSAMRLSLAACSATACFASLSALRFSGDLLRFLLLSLWRLAQRLALLPSLPCVSLWRLTLSLPLLTHLPRPSKIKSYHQALICLTGSFIVCYDWWEKQIETLWLTTTQHNALHIDIG